MSSMQHGTGNGNNRGNCQQFQNPLDSSAGAARAVRRARRMVDPRHRPAAEPACRGCANGTMVPPLPQTGVGFPNIPGVTYNGLKTTRYLLDYGPRLRRRASWTSIRRWSPPPYQDNPANGPIYPSFVPDDRRRRQRHRRRPAARRDGAARHLHRAGRCARRPRRRRRLRRRGAVHPVPEDKGRARGVRAIRGCRSRSATRRSPPTTTRLRRPSTTSSPTAGCCGRTRTPR